MLPTDIPEIWQSSSDAVTLHALWGGEEDTQPSTLRMDAALKMLLDRFKVDSAVVTLKDADGTFVKIVCGTDPLMMDCRNALKACAEGGNSVFVVEDSAARYPERNRPRRIAVSSAFGQRHVDHAAQTRSCSKDCAIRRQKRHPHRPRPGHRGSQQALYPALTL